MSVILVTVCIHNDELKRRALLLIHVPHKLSGVSLVMRPVKRIASGNDEHSNVQVRANRGVSEVESWSHPGKK